MSNSPLVTYTKISPNRTSPRNHEIDIVTIHCVVGQLTAKAIANLDVFTETRYQSSCNYAVGCDGSIALIVPEGDRSWCSSNRENDHRAITIEVASGTKPPYTVTAAAYEALIRLLTDICMRHPNMNGLRWKGDKSLIGQPDKQNMTVHKWFANKDCPGEYLYSRHAKIAAEVNARLSNLTIKPADPQESKPNKKDIQKGDVVSLNMEATYYNGTPVPSWVLKKQWIVKEVAGDRVVIDKSVDGKNAINSPVHAKYLTVTEPKSEFPYQVQISIDNLRIRTGPGTNYSHNGKFTGKGVFTIVEVKSGNGSISGWGLLKSYKDERNGWISLDYAKKI